ncbi:hypothetical protein [Zobellia barbeyronii]|uniref:Uncharacterized protein n=1 Tax=Zobellia barbeyronii TaxID=2748009 RepID=A0ABS5WAZ4_9FLAO|nr:hypothetical protein [Zobellia barbeyronii]MBT2160577.1 hypothetical protein [Zobellia barbeyronii]
MKLKSARTSPLLFIIVFFFGFLFAQAQTLYALKIDRNIRFEAIDITAEYQPRLVMGTKQALEFQNTVAKHIVKRESITNNPDISYREKEYLLKKISSHESSEMADVLYSYQWHEYLRIKPDIQPLIHQKRNLDDSFVENKTTN